MKPTTDNQEAPKVRSLFLEALDKAPGPERAAYLDQACGPDAQLRARVEALLKAHEGAGGFLQPPGQSLTVELETATPAEGAGTVIGRYKLLEKIGEGGMAVVYLAEQQEPLRRKVALKIIKLGMDTRQVIARFEAERQALALMDHPSIAKVLDAGATESGRPYFVMELVTGVSITEYCDQNSLSTKDRLALFLQVCHTVQHAHQKGIIHRDIKPSNVMVTHHDGKPVPKVIDFGIAKATNQKLTEKTLFTRYAHIIGTPAYMSPEQAELSDLDIDTRSDIYSLGVLLYELLTGTTPFSEEELRKAGYIQMQRVICEQEPVKPSTRIRTATREHRSVGAGPRACPTSGGHGGPPLREVRGDLDWIVMKALEKDRVRRYETASGLAEDVRRHLEHEPILARGPSTAYRLRKFLRRHRWPTIAALVTIVFAGAAVVVLSLWTQARLQLAEAQEFRDRGLLSQAREQYAKADRDAALETIEPVLQSRHVGSEAQLLQAGILVDNRRFQEAVTILNALLGERPEVAGAAHALLARILWESESPDAENLKKIEEHRRQAEALLPETAEAYFLRAMTALTTKERLAGLDKALQLDPSHYEARRLRAFTYYASRKYDRLREEALVMAVSRPRDRLGHSLQAVALRELARYAEAITEYDSALALTPKTDPQYVDLAAERSGTFLRMGDYERVVAETETCQDLWPEKPLFQYYRFCALTALGDYEKAAALFRLIVGRAPTSRNEFRDWCEKYVFDTLEAGRSWHPADRAPAGAAFLPMVEAEETYCALSAKGQRVATNGFSATWSPDGKKLAFSLGVQGRSGVALFDPATKETDLLIVPGKDPRWSPDGKYIAFVRDRQNLRLEDLAMAEGESRQPPVADEEVWLMRSDGTVPRRLVRGGWPSWGQDSTTIYYHSRVDKMLCSISLTGQDSEPKQVMKCSNGYPSVSPDDQRVAYLDETVLKISDLASQTLVAEWPVPFATSHGVAWSPTGRELCLAGSNRSDDRAGLWICGFDRSEPARLLGGQITGGSWAPDGTKFVFCLGPPHFAIWVAEPDTNAPTADALGPGQTLDEYIREMVRLHTRRIEVDPQDAYSYFARAHYYDYLHDRERVYTDMGHFSAILGAALPSCVQLAAPRILSGAVNGPFGYQLAFSVGRRDSGIQVLCVAFGQKGRCEMRVCAIPMLAMSLFGLGLLSGVDTPPAHAGFTFGEPVKVRTVVPALDDEQNIIVCCFSYDAREMYVTWNKRSGGYGSWDLWVLRRTSTDEPWGPPENLGPAVNGPSQEILSSISADGLTLYFMSNRGGGYGDYDIYMTTRATRNDSWGPAINMGPTINSSSGDGEPWISTDGLELVVHSRRPGGYGRADIYMAKRPTENDPWTVPVNLGPLVNCIYDQQYPSLSPDGLLLLFCDGWYAGPRPGGHGASDLWMSRRASRFDPWQMPVNLGPIANGPAGEYHPRISPDGRALYFGSDRGGGTNWQVPILPNCDFNGDGVVDEKDLLVMIEHWGQNYPLCDIGPFAWGDGVVDLKDLKVLAEHMGKDVEDPTLAAHWAFDEKEGTIAHDSAGKNDAVVVGNPVWQPAGGKVGGALQFDGKDDVVQTGPVAGLDQGVLSVFAWVKGGAPGQVVLSHSKGAKWLYLSPIDGSLTTELRSPNRTTTLPLLSDAVLTDGQWHRIGVVWDGKYRILYADDKEVDRDTQPEVTITEGGFLMGAGTAAGTPWTGLIDDVRIYSRVVEP